MEKTAFDINQCSRHYLDHKFKNMSYWQKLKKVDLITFANQVPNHAFIIGLRYGVVVTFLWYVATLLWAFFDAQNPFMWSINHPLLTPDIPGCTEYLFLFFFFTTFFASCTFINRAIERTSSIAPFVIFIVPTLTLIYQFRFISHFSIFEWPFTLASFFLATSLGLSCFLLILSSILIYFFITENIGIFSKIKALCIKITNKFIDKIYLPFAEWLLGRDIDFRNPH